MWTAIGDDEPGDGPPRYSAPENELPVALAVNLVLTRTDDVAVALTRMQVYSTGLTFDLVVRLRPSASTARDGRLNELLWRHGPASSGFLLGVGFADGRRASTLRGPRGRADVVLVSGGGGGGMSAVDQSWWLHPLPPEGPLAFVVRCDELGIAESVTELDGTAVRRAAEGVVTLWPWEPPPEETLQHEPPPPPVPADSWFAGG